MDNMISAIRSFIELRTLPFHKRLKYGLEIVRLGKIRHSESKQTFLFGFNINYDRYDSLCLLLREIFIDRLYNCQLKTRSPLIFDVGSNIGIATLFFKFLYPDSTVYCFEPDPETFSILEKNAKENNLKDVFLTNAGLSDFTGSSTLFVPSWSSGSSSLFRQKVAIEKGFADMSIQDSSLEEKEIRVLRFSDFIEEKGIRHIVSIKPLWMTHEPQVLATYIVRAFGKGKI